MTWSLDQLVPPPPLLSNEEVCSIALRNLTRAHSARKAAYDSHRNPNPFNIDDWVMCREQHHRSNATNRANAKLLPLWYCPLFISAFSAPVTVALVDQASGKQIRSAHILHLKRL